MHPRLILCFFAIAFLALTNGARGAETFLKLTIEPGETLGGGMEHVFTAAQARFFGRSYFGGGFASFTIEERPSGRRVGTFTLAAPQNARLEPGLYAHVVEGGFYQLPDQPTMELTLFSSGCGSSSGNFLIKELITGEGESPVQSAWIIFEYHCGEFPPGLLGELRWQSARRPLELEAPLGRSVALREPIEILVATRSLLDGAPELHAAELPAGAVFTDLGDGTGRLQWTPQPGQVGAHTVQLQARHSSGAMDRRPMRIVVQGETALILESEPGDGIAPGQNPRYDLTNARFQFFNQDIAIDSRAHGYGLTVQADGVYWSLLFAPPPPYSFLPGIYEDAASRDFQDASRPLLSVQGNLSDCASSQFGRFLSVGRFQVEQLLFEGPKVRSFRATFTSRCAEGTAGVRGEIRFNADPFPPANRPPILRCSGAEQSCLPPEGTEIPVLIEIGDPEGGPLDYVIEVDGVIVQNGSRAASVPGSMERIPFAPRFLPGLHTLRVSAVDSSGQTNNCFVRVDARADRIPPLLECPPAVVVSPLPGECAAWLALTPPRATDECGSPSVQGRRSDGAPLSAPFPEGDTVVFWSAIDAAGNAAECEQIVRVLDQEGPSLTPRFRHAKRKVDEPVEVQLNSVDNCDARPAVVIVDTATRATYGPFPSGTRFKIWTGLKKEKRPGWRQAGQGVFELRLQGQAEAYSYDRSLNRSPALTLPRK